MKLAALLAEIERSPGPVTGIELAQRLGISPARVASMLVALRASGRIVGERRTETPRDACAGGGSCSMTCPGPEECALTVGLVVTGLQIRPTV